MSCESVDIQWHTIRPGLCAVCLLFFTFQASYVLTDWWLFKWSSKQYSENPSSVPSLSANNSLPANSSSFEKTSNFSTLESTTSHVFTNSSSQPITIEETNITSTQPITVEDSTTSSWQQPIMDTYNNISTSGSFEPITDMYIYLAVCVGFLVLSFIRAVTFSTMAVSASKLFHVKLFSAIMRAPLGFFDKNPVGE